MYFVLCASTAAALFGMYSNMYAYAGLCMTPWIYVLYVAPPPHPLSQPRRVNIIFTVYSFYYSLLGEAKNAVQPAMYMIHGVYCLGVYHSWRVSLSLSSSLSTPYLLSSVSQISME